MSTEADATDAVSRQGKRTDRQHAIADAVMRHGSLRIEDIADQFKISVMTAHRDLDELQARGLLRKSRGTATALASTLVESSVVYRQAQRTEIKRALATAALDYLDTGQSVLLDDSTTVHQIIPLLADVAPLTVITNSLIAINEVSVIDDISVIGLGGEFHPWCASFMGRMTNQAIGRLRSDLLLMSAAAIVGRTVCFQALETVDTKRAMLDASATRVLLVDHTKFTSGALHALGDLDEFDHVVVDRETPRSTVAELRRSGIDVVVADR
ncbi:DeoR/GlpR family DNA-binding transcription regulator [Microlunatus soli]|uniref:DNA-binding transcriptional regulator of sugar metabolism, DeoR/GlpR family n=1 Tax=Microlunatus soli TaxID=630515 RepID=A0A1H2APM6_9ACTN|nr:DeoR/GlpR family DNA-binding transcription regulator [Microlunatus soli]SDT47851.1 DNA-binding transcriptional regulator of sugar metabolism, DeoR/GlpR family [Microlunatus soli]